MRNPYTCIFERTLRTRVWSLSPSTRCVWLWLRLVADPEGYVNADLAGVAAGANVSAEEARRAIEGFCAPDPDADPDDPHEGRVLERVRGGWLILDYAQSVELVRTETRNARNAKYARARRARESAEREEARAYLDLEDAASNDNAPTEGHADARVAPSRSKSRSKLSSEGEKTPPGPSHPVDNHSVGYEAEVIVPAPRRLHAIPDAWEPSESLRAAASMAGVTDFDGRLAGLRCGPIGGHRGVFETGLEAYIKTFFGKWKTWEETDRAKARASTAAAASKPRKPWEPEEPLIDLDLRVLDTNIKRYIEHHGLGEWGPLVREWLDEATRAGKKLTRPEAVKALKGWLAARAKARAA